jgi:hypothetical protein
MDLSPYVGELRSQLGVAAEAGGDDARALADRLTGPLEAATRLVLLEALSAAAGEITRELAPGSVEVRLRGRDPEFVVTQAAVPAFEEVADRPIAPPPASAGSGDTDDGGTSRTTLRLPEQVKVRVELAAARDGVSVNTWLVRAITAALETKGRRPSSREPRSGEHLTGWVG